MLEFLVGVPREGLGDSPTPGTQSTAEEQLLGTSADQPPSCSRKTPSFSLFGRQTPSHSPLLKGNVPSCIALSPSSCPLPSISSLHLSLPLSSTKGCQGNRITNDFPLCLGPSEEIHKPSCCSLTPDDPCRAVQPWTTPSRPPHPTPLISANIPW